MKKYLRVITLCLLVFQISCGGSQPDDSSNSSATSQSLSPLVGLWLADQINSSGLRLAISFENSASNPSNLVVNLYLVDIDGSDLGGLKGTATTSNNQLTLTLDNLDPITDTFSVSSKSLTLGDLTCSKVDGGTVSPLQGNGNIQGTVSLPTNAMSLTSAPFVPGQVLVEFKDGVGTQSALSITNNVGLEKISDIPGFASLYVNSSTTAALTIDTSSTSSKLLAVFEAVRWTKTTLEELNQNPRVKFAQPNYIYKTFATTPNDSNYNLQWDYSMMNLPQAWDVTTGSDNVIVAVIDSGSLNHPDIASRISGGFDFITSPTSSGDGDGPDPDFTDSSNVFHGLHVAGTIGALTNNNLGVAGVTWKTQLLVLRAMGKNGVGNSADIANAVLYAAGLPNSSGKVPAQRANVINMSLGSLAADLIIDRAVVAAIVKGVTVVAAAGNSNSTSIGSPASVPGVIAVGAVDLNSTKAPYSNYGSRIDVVAPGGDKLKDLNGDTYPDGILSTYWNITSNAPSYYFSQGTSMACPHVAGVVALMLAVNPNLQPSQVLSILTSTATDLGTPGKDNTFGFGLVNAFKATQAAQGGGGPGTNPSLSVVPANVTLSINQKSTQVLIQNTGGGSVSNLATSIDSITGGNWLSLSLDTTSAPAILTVSATTTGLVNGNYSAVVKLNSSVGSINMNVNLSIGQNTGGNVGSVYVVIINPADSKVISTVTTNSTSNYQFSMQGVPAGRYLVIASTDKDGDGKLCGSTELCGTYPSADDPQFVPILPNLLTANVIIPINANASIQSLDSGELINEITLP